MRRAKTRDKGTGANLMRTLRLNCLFLVFLGGSAFLGYCSEKRPMTPSDLFQLSALSGLDQMAVSPDGEFVAYVLQRPMATGTKFGRPWLWGEDRADIWLASLKSGESANITNGATDDTGFWQPTWSPDGQWLSMFSTRGGGVRLWVWSKSTGRLEMLSPGGVDPGSPVSSNAIWISDDEMVFCDLINGIEPELIQVDTQTPEAAKREWAKAWKGQEASVSVLESGIASAAERHPEMRLLRMNVRTGKVQLISTAPSFATLRLSPDRHSLAFLEQVGVWHPNSNSPMKELTTRIFKVVVASLPELTGRQTMKGVAQPYFGSVIWSPDSSEIALFADGTSLGTRSQVFRCTIAEDICRPAANVPLEFGILSYINGIGDAREAPYLWFGKHDLLLQGRRSTVEPSAKESPKWWKTDKGGSTHEFFDVPREPIQLLPDPPGNGLLGLIDGKVWRIGDDGRLIQDLTEGLEEMIASVERPNNGGIQGSGGLILNMHSPNIYYLESNGPHLTQLIKPASSAELSAITPQGKTTVFSASDSTGTYLWLKREGHEGFRTLLETNLFLREIEESKLKQIEYQSLEGQELKGWAVLPFNFHEGRRYPTVVWVYPAVTFGNVSPHQSLFDSINNSHPLNLQLLAAHGYVVLLPSMPMKPFGSVRDLYIELSNGVLPAVRKLVEMGIADSERIGVMGQSFGGYATYGLVTQTKRFRAAVALGGFCDLVSLYGTFDARYRYQPLEHQSSFPMWNLETLGMGTPPWRDLNRYHRNSPIEYVERVETPVLIIQGDLDLLPIQQGEEFFTALYRQNKRAEFARYWGEDHLFSSPANIADMWGRVFAWLDGFLKSDQH